MTERCAQCGHTFGQRPVEHVTRGDQTIALHKGGCPTPRKANT